ncbi:MAG: hypothetical protein O3A00_07945 [Planctomycetota bacterium]|nr:hypothetical protein [Planctomycetota bacterium]
MPDTTPPETPGRLIDGDKGRTFPCEGCGADLKFSIDVQNLKCPFCAYEKRIEFSDDEEVAEQDFHAILEKQCQHRRGQQADAVDEQQVRCDSCGANVLFSGTITSSECPYCASPMQLEGAHTADDRIPVDGVLSFQVKHDAAQDNLVGWVKSRWFAPNEFLNRGVSGKFNGVYLPFWTFDAMTFTRYRGERGEHYFVEVGEGDEKKRERRTRWHYVSGRLKRFFDDLLILASQGLPTRLIDKLQPWPLERVVPFNQEMLAGYFARTYEIGIDAGFAEAKDRMEDAIADDVRDDIGGDEQRVHSSDTQFSAITYKHLLLPVWLLAYRYHEKSYQVMVNAATGEVQGERPYSWIKITIAVVLGLVFAAGVAILSQV